MASVKKINERKFKITISNGYRAVGRKLYVALRKEKNMINGNPLSELTVDGVHACLCGILSDAVESGLLDHNPAWRTYKYSNIDKKQQVVADEEILQKLICALEI